MRLDIALLTLRFLDRLAPAACLSCRLKTPQPSRAQCSAVDVLQATIAGGGVIPHIHKSLINKVRLCCAVCSYRDK
jgi:C-terminus of histone H2A